MLIIVEGPDGAGKSTLVRRLAVELTVRETQGSYDDHETVELLHRGPPTAHPLDEYENPLHDYHPGAGRHIICDRWHLGELVYPPLFDRETRYDAAVHRHVDLFLLSRGALVVGLTPYAQELAERLEVRTSLSRFDELTLRETNNLLASYDLAYGSCATFVMRGAQPSLDDIFFTAQMLEQDVHGLTQFVTYVGPPRPNFLLFGETRGVKGSLAVGPAPAFVPYGGTSGHYLLSHLQTELRGRSVGLANACDVDDPVALWKTLGEPQTVALGAVVHRRLTELGVPHGVVPHPQFVRRFHHYHGSRYAEVIWLAAREQEDMSKWRP